MSKMQTEAQTDSAITEEEFIKLYQKGPYYQEKFQKIYTHLRALTPEKASSIIHINNDEAFCIAAGHGDIKIMQLLLEYTPDPEQRDKMIHANNNALFRAALSCGKSITMKFLLDLTPDPEQRNQMLKSIHADDNLALRSVANSGEVEAIQLILKHASDLEQYNQIMYDKDEVILRNVVTYCSDRFCLDNTKLKHIRMIKFLIENAPDPECCSRMIHANNDEAFKKAVTTEKRIYYQEGTYLYNYYYCGNGVDCPRPSGIVIGDGIEELINIFLEFDPDYFEMLSKTLEITPKTAEYITRTAQEIREIRAHNVNIMTKVIQKSVDSNPELPRLPDVICNLMAQYEGGHRPKIVIGSHTERYLVEQSGNIVRREESGSQKDTVDSCTESYFSGHSSSSYRSNKSYMR